MRPGHVHRKVARRVMVYLLRTREMRITYRKSALKMEALYKPQEGRKTAATANEGLMHMPVDSNHGVDRSITGWVIMMAGAAVAWAVRYHVGAPALSTAEIELKGLTTAMCDLLAAMQVAEEVGVKFKGKVIIATDSRGARLLAQDCAAAARVRHIHRRWYFSNYHTEEEEGTLAIRQVAGAKNPSNSLTKPVGGAPFGHDRGYFLGDVREASTSKDNGSEVDMLWVSRLRERAAVAGTRLSKERMVARGDAVWPE